MSHLQPGFIAKAKSQQKNSRRVRQLPGKMFKSAVERVVRVGPVKGKRYSNTPQWWHFEYFSSPHYMPFMLKKGR